MGELMNYVPAKIVAEIGATHVGNMERAKHLIKLAAFAGADYVKTQKRNPTESTPKELQSKPHPNKLFSYGETYLKHREALEFNIGQHKELKEYSEQLNIGYASSVWDISSAHEIISLNPDFIKVPSACNMHWKLLDVLFNEYEGDIHISLGMVTYQERCDINGYLAGEKCRRTVLYHCTSEYPCPFERLYLKEITNLKYNPSKEVGFSDHGYGIASDIVSYALGARWIERHFIDDRTFRHSDAAASLEPEGLRKLCRDLKAMYKALTCKDGLSTEEQKQRDKLQVKSD